MNAFLAASARITSRATALSFADSTRLITSVIKDQ